MDRRSSQQFVSLNSIHSVTPGSMVVMTIGGSEGKERKGEQRIRKRNCKAGATYPIVKL